MVNNLGKIPTQKDVGTVIETEKVAYKIEMVEDKHIVKVKACKTSELDKNSEE